MTRNKKRVLSIILIILVALITIIISSKEAIAVPEAIRVFTYSDLDVENLGTLSQFYANPYMYCLNHGWEFAER